MGHSSSSRRNLMSCGKVRMFLSASRWLGIGSALIDFHPALERRLDAHRRIHALQVCVLDVLEHLRPDVLEHLFLGGALPWGVRLAAETVDDLAGIFEDGVGVHGVEIPSCCAGGLGEFACLLIEGGQGVAEENAAGSLGGTLSSAEERARQSMQAFGELRLILYELMIFKVHLFDDTLHAFVGMIEFLERRVIVLGCEQFLTLDT